MSSNTVAVTITVNGKAYRRDIPDDLTLLDFLHEELDLTGTKLCCGIGMCRACTVAVQKSRDSPLTPVLACSMPASLLDGQAITTVEGLGDPGRLSALQKAFLDDFAFQCGYCAPGFLMAAHMLLDELRRAPIPRAHLDAAIAEACGEHICRCTGYRRYYQAIQRVVLEEPGLVQ
jgi:aerobic-type carbon monoxide dehydrogenase small subunit (CoxS/CutS family)